MQYYELTAIFPTTQTQDETEAAFGRVLEILKKQDVEVVRKEGLGKFRLAYPIKHVQHGDYFLILFQAEAEKIKPIREALTLNGETLRFTIEQTDKGALKRVYKVIQYEAPVVERARRRILRRPHLAPTPISKPAVPAPAPAPAPAAPAKPISTEEIEEQIDKILEEKII